ncbi:ribosomal protein S18 acetylase RimI-like enzyme [Cytobacillus horneckiae]|uniref:N-acetyltransferase n=1 Tax=Cytobacillus horneckiae TaxID=549687 RepID=A0A2N0ZJU0_9BACI|nr:GNAT family N-acetyltransferase [Cytobacillus horneckiae]MBN6889855.1 GNAT family N-acetyltransferase [Cytobacillus horneckiae]MCM3181154.1 GNAT family N-acetyltransferase [Cytobacillus horneckiae]MEC1159241.1 GNAT family N-acetyltransferase [Cytobacillus horneckiae]MED2940418.1 GNAT family N-acetyltransferase [Cytobacillus horneckiae]PKG29785.1 N-acetyltransferase [Cytobacillus horneckiae]
MQSGDNKFIIVKADKIDLDVRLQISEIFAEGFTQWLGYFSKDKSTIAKAFAHMFVLNQFYVAIANDKVAGMTACTDGKTFSIKLNKKELRKHLGFFKGSIAGIFLKKEFEAPYEKFPPNTGSIEFVGTAHEFKGQGVASQIIQYIFENTPYKNYVIEEVADTNIPAMNLYKKLGFKEYKRKPLPEKLAKKNGINNLLSLRYMEK